MGNRWGYLSVLKSRSGQDRRQVGRDRELADREIKQVRAFDWTKLLLPHAPLLLKIIPLLTIGGVAATQGPKVYDLLSKDEIEIPAGQTVDLENEVHGDAFEAQARQALKAINAELAALKKQIQGVSGHTTKHDTEQDQRLDHIEGLVQ